MMKYIFLFIVGLCSMGSFAQFAPQAGLSGSTAMYKDSSVFVYWASNCSVNRGWMDIADTSLGKVTFGDSSKAFGKADGDVVSLGDAGEAIFFFENPIVNGDGFDFAVFENGFQSPTETGAAYLELAQVEVSNDGIHYYPFASVCNNDTILQIAGAGDYMDATRLNNLAGKYIAGYGTPFDLDEFSVLSSLDINNIRFLKIKDVVGTMNDLNCVRDINQHKINDPYPTPFPTGGFDLDAIGIIHQKFATVVNDKLKNFNLRIYPNPAQDLLSIESDLKISAIKILSMEGKVLLSYSTRVLPINISFLEKGNYILSVMNEQGFCLNQMILKQ